MERSLLSLPTRYGGLNIGIPCDEAIHEYENSRLISSDLTTAIIEQNDDHIQNQNILKENKNKIKTSREKRYKEKSCIIREQLNGNLRRLHEIAQEKGVSNCNPSHKLLRQMRKMVLFRLATSNVKLLLETIWSG